MSRYSILRLDTVRSARAVVVGAGALGNEATKCLGMMGVRHVTIVDRDTVENANLTRSIFFREPDQGRFKAEVVAARVRELNPDVSTLALVGDLQDVLGLGLLRRCDVVLSCLDNRLARRALNRMAQKVGRPWVDGAMEELLGDVSVYMPDEGPCYECGLTPTDLQILAFATSCPGVAMRNLALGRIGTTPTMGSIIGSLQVQEALKVLHRPAAKPLEGQRLVVNCETNDYYVTRADRKAACPGHFRFGAITEEPAFRSATTRARELIDRYREETGTTGYVSLGRDVVTDLSCSKCGENEELLLPRHRLDDSVARCIRCGDLRDPQTIRVVQDTDARADLPLARFGIPALDVLEVGGSAGSRWYELTGDLESFPAAVR